MPRKKLATRLAEAGFTPDEQVAEQYAAARDGLPSPAEIRGAWRNGPVTVVVEENTVQGTPPVAVVEGSGGRVLVVNPDDLDLLMQEVEKLGAAP